jgi:hypothetical protein
VIERLREFAGEKAISDLIAQHHGAEI